MSTPTGHFRKNRRHLKLLPIIQPIASPEHSVQVSTSQNPQVPHAIHHNKSLNLQTILNNQAFVIHQTKSSTNVDESAFHRKHSAMGRNSSVELKRMKLVFIMPLSERKLCMHFTLSFLTLFTCFLMVAIRCTPKGGCGVLHGLHSLSLSTCYSCTRTMSVTLHPMHRSRNSLTPTCMPLHTHKGCFESS